MPDERTYLISKTEDLGSNGGHSLGDDVLELRSWLDDPYEQISELPSERYSATLDGSKDNVTIKAERPPSLARLAKVAILSCLMLISLVTSMFYIEESKDSYLINPCIDRLQRIVIEDISYCERVAVTITGNIEQGVSSWQKNNSEMIMVQLKSRYYNETDPWDYPQKADKSIFLTTSEDTTVRVQDMSTILHTFIVDSLQDIESMAIYFTSWTDDRCASINIQYSCRSVSQDYQVMIAIFLLFIVYALIMFEVIHRTSAALLGASLGIACLAILNMRPELEEVLRWIDWETIALLMGMMLMVAVLADSGFFDWAAVKVYELSKGRTWVLVTLLCAVTTVLSAFLDNVTTILLISPVTITLCQVMHMDPVKVLLALVMFSNIGGASTGIGDPPNVLIINSDGIKDVISFSTFSCHMGIGSVLCCGAAYLYIWFIYRWRKDALIVQNGQTEALLREAELWKRIAGRSSMRNNEEVAVKEMLLNKARKVEQMALSKTVTSKTATTCYAVNLPKLRAKYTIRDKGKLLKTSLVLALCITLFFIYSLPNIHTAPGEIAMAGAIALIILIDHRDMEGLLQSVEWATLMFFAGLFILVECLSRLGLVAALGDLAVSCIKAFPGDWQLTAAITIILWMSAIISAFIDNIPFTAGIVPVIVALSKDETLDLPLEPLVYALAFGACLGGNGTLIGASANVVAVGVAEEKGYKITFLQFAKLGMPIMFITVAVANVYLIVCHIVIGWH